MGSGSYDQINKGAKDDYSFADPTGQFGGAMDQAQNVQNFGRSQFNSGLSAMQNNDPQAFMNQFQQAAPGLSNLVSVQNQLGQQQIGLTGNLFNQSLGNFAQQEAQNRQMQMQRMGMGGDMMGQGLQGQLGLARDMGGAIAPQYEYQPGSWDKTMQLGGMGAELGGKIAMAKAVSACIHPSSTISTPEGEIAVSKIAVGDVVYDAQGSECEVTEKVSYDETTSGRFYKIADGAVICDTHELEDGTTIRQRGYGYERALDPSISYDLKTNGCDSTYQLGGIGTRSMIETLREAV